MFSYNPTKDCDALKCAFINWILANHNLLSFCALTKLRSVQNTGTCYPGQGWFVRRTWAEADSPGVPDKSNWGLGSMSILLYFSLESRLIPAVLELGHVRLFWKLIWSRIWQLSPNWGLGVFSKQFSIKIMKYEDRMLILGQNDIFCSHSVVNFSVWFLQLAVFKYLVASHVTEMGSLLTEPCAVIKFSHFSSQPGTCMLWYRIYPMKCAHGLDVFLFWVYWWHSARLQYLHC